MKLDGRCIDFEYTPGGEIFTFPEDTGLPLLFDVNEELTDNSSAMDAVGGTLDEAETLAGKTEAAIKAALADESNPYHDLATFFIRFHQDDVGPDTAADPLPGTDPVKLSFIEVMDFSRLKRFDSLVNGKTGQRAFILDLSFNPEITNELIVIYFDLNKKIFCTTHENWQKRRGVALAHASDSTGPPTIIQKLLGGELCCTKEPVPQSSTSAEDRKVFFVTDGSGQNMIILFVPGGCVINSVDSELYNWEKSSPESGTWLTGCRPLRKSP